MMIMMMKALPVAESCPEGIHMIQAGRDFTTGKDFNTGLNYYYDIP